MQKVEKVLSYGVAMLAAVSFFIGWMVTLPKFIRLPIFNGVINAPIADFVGLVLLVDLFLALALGVYQINRERWQELKKGIIFFSLFILGAVISAFFVYHHDILLSLKYVLRSEIFVFLVFFLLPIAVINNLKSFWMVLYVWFIVGTVVSVYGLTSFLLLPESVRAMPYMLWSFAPLGINQNAIAETLTGVLPFVAILFVRFWFEKSGRWKLFPVGLAGLLMVLTAMLTLSRTAWIVLIIQFGMLAYWYAENFSFIPKRIIKVVSAMAVILSMTLAAYMGFFLGSSPAVSSSNSSRGLMIKIAGERFAQAPVFGSGPGTFYRIIGESEAFIYQFGAPLDAHGILQKILTEQGIIGLLLFGLFISSIIWFIFQTSREARGFQQLLARLLCVAVVGSVVFQFFSTSYYTATMWLPIGLAVTGSLLIRERTL